MKVTSAICILLIIGLFSLLTTYSQNSLAKTDITIDELSNLSGEAFYNGIGNIKHQCQSENCADRVIDFWRFLDKAKLHGVKEGGYHQYFATDTLLKSILAYGDNRDFEKLLTYYDPLSLKANHNSLYIERLSEYWLKRELESIYRERKPNILSLVETDQRLPDYLESASPELKKAWRSYKGLMNRFGSHIEQIQLRNKKSVQNSWPAFHNDITKFLKGEQNQALKNISSLKWGSWCGTGLGALTKPKSRTQFMALLKDREYELALGALFNYTNVTSLRSVSLESSFVWKKKFIEHLGLDWELLFLGAALDKQPGYLSDIAAYGSEGLVSIIEDINQLEGMIPQLGQELVHVSTGLITQGCSKSYERTHYSPVNNRKQKFRMSDVQQKRFLSDLSSYIKSNSKRQNISKLSEVLAYLCRIETKDALHKILHSTQYKDKERAAKTLNALGVSVEAIKNPGNILFRLSLDGTPLINKKIEYSVYNNGSRYLSSSTQTNEEGFVKVDREAFLDPVKNITITFHSPNKLKGPEEPYYYYIYNPAKNISKQVELNIPTTSLTLNIKPGKAIDLYSGQTMEISLRYLSVDGEKIRMSNYNRKMKYKLPVGPSVTFPSLSPGVYEVIVKVPGAVTWHQEKLTVNNSEREKNIRLSSPRSIKFEISAPGIMGINKDINIDFHLKIIESQSRTSKITDRSYNKELRSLDGIPEGEHILVIYSSETKDQMLSIVGSKTNKENGFLDYKAKEIKIKIDEDSPKVIDLGTIKLEQI